MRGLEEARAYMDCRRETNSSEAFRDAAYSYLGEWLLRDRRYFEELQCSLADRDRKPDPGRGARALAGFAAEYSVARTLPGKTVCGFYLYAFKGLSDIDIADCPSAVVRYAEYLGRDTNSLPLSAASKFLWLRFREKVPIYDSLAWRYLADKKNWTGEAKALTARANKREWYPDFYKAWDAAYRTREGAVREACKSVLELKACAAGDSEHYFRGVGETWFEHRVFDHYMLTAQSEKDEATLAAKAAS